MLIGAATSRMTAIVGPPRATEIGISAVRTARPRSARNIIRLRSLRSASAPATIPKTRSGRVCSAPTMPIAQPGPGQRQDEQRQRREADRVAERRDALGREQDLEVAVPGQRLQVRVASGIESMVAARYRVEERGMVEWRSSP